MPVVQHGARYCWVPLKWKFNLSRCVGSTARRFENGFQLTAAYTWSHLIDDTTAEVFSTVLSPRRVEDFQNLAKERADSALDRRHRFVSSAFYELPWFRNDSKSSFGRCWEDSISQVRSRPSQVRRRPCSPVSTLTRTATPPATAPSQSVRRQRHGQQRNGSFVLPGIERGRCRAHCWLPGS